MLSRNNCSVFAITPISSLDAGGIEDTQVTGRNSVHRRNDLAQRNEDQSANHEGHRDPQNDRDGDDEICDTRCLLTSATPDPCLNDFTIEVVDQADSRSLISTLCWRAWARKVLPRTR